MSTKDYMVFSHTRNATPEGTNASTGRGLTGFLSYFRVFGMWCVLAIAFAGVSQQAFAQNNAALVAQNVPVTMVAGRSYTVSVTMKNTGTTTWTDGANYRLGSQAPQDNSIWGTSRVMLGGTVPPGKEHTFTFEVRAPAAAGSYAFQWQMLQEAVSGFGSASTNVQVPVASVAAIPAWTTAVTPLPAPPKSITRVTEYEYDPTTGLLVKQIVEPNEAQLRVDVEYPIAQYDSYGNAKVANLSSPATGTAAIVARGTSSSYDARGRFVTSSTNAAGHVGGFAFDARFGTTTNVTDPNLLSTTAEYDGFGRRTRVVAADGNITKWSYQFCSGFNGGNAACPALAKYVVEMTQVKADGETANGPWIKNFYDQLNRSIATSTVGFDGVSVIKSTTEYDDFGNVFQVSRPFFEATQTAILTTFYYDALGRVTKSVQPESKTTTFGYEGLTTTITNVLLQKRTQIKDALGRVSKVLDATDSENTLSYQYDPFDRLTSTTDAKQNVVSMAYNKLGHKLQLVDPDLGSWTYESDVLGARVRETDAKSQTTKIFYDKLGRVTSRQEPDLKSTWTYDACTMGLGKLCSSEADNGFSSSIVYDTLGRTASITKSIDGNHVSEFKYDANGRLETLRYPTGFAIKYGYTNLGYLETIRNVASNALYWTALQRDAAGQLLLQKYGNDIVTQQVFEPNTGRLSDVYAGAGNIVQNLSFKYDDVGNLKIRGDANQFLSETFTYDALQRLRTSTVNAPGAGTPTQTYDYDSIGNIKSRSDVGVYSAGALNARPHGIDNIALAGGATRYFDYDANGNMKYQMQFDVSNKLEPAKSRCTSFTSFNMPKKMATPTAAVVFNYGPDHERTKMLTGGTTTVFVHTDNAGGLLYEKDMKSGQDAEHRYFISAGGQLVALIKKDITGTTSVNYMHQDQLGSVTAITNESGTVLERLAYEPFGKRRNPEGGIDQADLIKGKITDRGFTSHQELDALGLVHMNGRVYDPLIGRFLSADPNVPDPDDMQSFNRYAYTRNNPLNSVDMNGFEDRLAVVYGSTNLSGSTSGGGSTGGNWTATHGFTTATFYPGGAGMDQWTWATQGIGHRPVMAPIGNAYNNAPAQAGNTEEGILKRVSDFFSGANRETSCDALGCIHQGTLEATPVRSYTGDPVQDYINDRNSEIATTIANAGMRFAGWWKTATMLGYGSVGETGTAITRGLGAANKSTGDIVYRALTAADEASIQAGTGLAAKAPNGTWTAAEHVANAGPGAGGAAANSPWISTTYSLDVAKGYEGGNGIVAIDLSKVRSVMFEVWRTAPRVNGVAGLPYHRSIWAQEMTIFQHVPQSAINRVK